MEKGVFLAKKKNGDIYYRASINYRGKHISLGSADSEDKAAAIYRTAKEVLEKKDANGFYHTVDINHMQSSYTKDSALADCKYISLINFRDNGIYFKTPIYLCRNYFLYFVDDDLTLKFSKDDLFYYSEHTIQRKDGYLFTAEYGMQVSILDRYGIRKHSVKGRDYIFRNGDDRDYSYENLLVINPFNGVSRREDNGRISYRAKIHVNGDVIIGDYKTSEEAAIAYNKACDLLEPLYRISYERNYIKDMTSIDYARLYNSVKLSNYIRELSEMKS